MREFGLHSTPTNPQVCTYLFLPLPLFPVSTPSPAKFIQLIFLLHSLFFLFIYFVLLRLIILPPAGEWSSDTFLPCCVFVVWVAFCDDV